MKKPLLQLVCACFAFLSFTSLESFSMEHVQKLSSDLFSEKLNELIEEQNLFEIEEIIKSKISSLNGAEKSNKLVLLSLLYLKDQREEEAFKTFLAALTNLTHTEESRPSENEMRIFNEQLPLYLEALKRPPEEVANELETRLYPVLQAHPEYNQLRFLVAASFANKRKYADFFMHFYQAFKAAPKCYMAYKTLAICHIKLIEKARTEDQKETERQEIERNLRLAIDAYKQDSMLYKLLLVFYPKNSHKEQVRQVLELIMANGVAIDRNELPFYVMSALDANEHTLGERFLDKVTNSDQYSRTVEELRKVLKSK